MKVIRDSDVGLAATVYKGVLSFMLEKSEL